MGDAPATEATEAPLVLVEDVVKSYEGAVVLDRVSLHADRSAIRHFADSSGFEPKKLAKSRVVRKPPAEIRAEWRRTHAADRILRA